MYNAVVPVSDPAAMAKAWICGMLHYAQKSDLRVSTQVDYIGFRVGLRSVNGNGYETQTEVQS